MEIGSRYSMKIVGMSIMKAESMILSIIAQAIIGTEFVVANRG
jgi:hypothetical protein